MPKATIVRVLNRGKNTYTHGEFIASPGEFADIPQEVYEIWKTNTEFGQKVIVLASEVKAAPTKEEADEALLAENLDLRKQLEELKKKVGMSSKPAKPDGALG